jgi:hypothetical protein
MEVYYRGEAIALRARPVVVRKAKKDHPWRQPYQTMDTDSQGADRSAARWDAHLRFALRASLQCASQRQHQPQKGDISN